MTSLTTKANIAEDKCKTKQSDNIDIILHTCIREED